MTILTPATEGKVRIDKWLWAARCFKTRSQATQACGRGDCLVNGERAKASLKVTPGDHVVVETAGGQRVLEVVALLDKRGPAEVAAQLFVDHTPPRERRTLAEQLYFEVERGQGRPRKRDRRAFNKIRGW